MRIAILALACAVDAIAQTTTTSKLTASSVAATTSSNHNVTAALIIGTASKGLVGTVAAVGSCSTTYMIYCTDTAVCSDNAGTLSVTAGPTNIQTAYRTNMQGFDASFTESCSVSGLTYAVCTSSVLILANQNSKTNTATSGSTTLQGTALHFAPIPLIGGLDKLNSASNTCQATTKSGSKGAAMPTGGLSAIREVVKVLVVPAAAAAMAGIMV